MDADARARLAHEAKSAASGGKHSGGHLLKGAQKRLAVSAGLKSHGIWDKVIKYDPLQRE